MEDKLEKNLIVARELWVKKKYSKALDIALRGATKDHAASQAFIGWIYLTGEYDNTKEAIKWLELSAKSGSSVGHYLLGIAYYRQKNYPDALHEFILASEKNYYDADYQIGKMYYFGIGVKKNIETSYQHFLIAKKYGHIFASRQVSVILMKGHKGAFNIVKGVLLFIKTVGCGVAVAIKNPHNEKILD